APEGATALRRVWTMFAELGSSAASGASRRWHHAFEVNSLPGEIVSKELAVVEAETRSPASSACWARAASGHPAAPPSVASNSRRPMVTVIRPSLPREVPKRNDTTPPARSLHVVLREPRCGGVFAEARVAMLGRAASLCVGPWRGPSQSGPCPCAAKFARPPEICNLATVQTLQPGFLG